MKIISLRKHPLFILALTSGLALATGCGDDDNAGPSTTTIEDEDASDSNEDTNDSNDDSDEVDASDTTTVSEPGSDTTTDSETTGGADASDTEEPEGDGGAPSTDGGAGTEDAGEATAIDAGTDGGPDIEECVENDEACFSCPSTPEQFLTQCTLPGTQCSAFDNATRLGRYVEGEALPTP
jgi:hypothetical protein